MAAGT